MATSMKCDITDILHVIFSVINLLEAVNATHSRQVASKVKGRDPGTPAWRFRSSTPHLMLPHDLVQYLRNTSQGVLGLHLVGRQKKNSEATLISLTSPVLLKQDGRPLLKLISNTQKDWFLMEFRSAEGFQPELMKLPGGSPFVNGSWVRMALNVEPRQLVLFVECQEAVVLKLRRGTGVLSLDLPDDLQVTFSSTAGRKASKFNVSLLTCKTAQSSQKYLATLATHGNVCNRNQNQTNLNL